MFTNIYYNCLLFIFYEIYVLITKTNLTQLKTMWFGRYKILVVINKTSVVKKRHCLYDFVAVLVNILRIQIVSWSLICRLYFYVVFWKRSHSNFRAIKTWNNTMNWLWIERCFQITFKCVSSVFDMDAINITKKMNSSAVDYLVYIRILQFEIYNKQPNTTTTTTTTTTICKEKWNSRYSS